MGRCARDPDRAAPWEDVVAVEYGSVDAVVCPICLDDAPTAPQTTTCGHAFCFPCVARHALTTREQGKPSKCPVCATEYRLGDLRSVRSVPIEPPRVGKKQKFVLMHRRRDSTVPARRDAKGTPAPAPGAWPRALPHCGCDAFAKYTLTGEEVAIATEELESLEARVAMLAEQSDVGELPFALAAIDALTRRLDRWVERRCAREGVEPPKSRALPPGVSAPATTTPEPKQAPEPEEFPALPPTRGTTSTTAYLKGSKVVVESAFTDDEEEELGSESESETEVGGDESVAVDALASSMKEMEVNQIKEKIEGESVHNVASASKPNDRTDIYYFYQAPDGQQVMLHSACMRVLLEHYGSYEALPQEVEGDVVEIENKTQDEEVRKRAAHIRHIPLTTEFVMIELDMKSLVEKKILDGPAGNELRQRAKRRSQKSAAEARAKAKERRAEAEARVKSEVFSKEVRESMPELGVKTRADVPKPDTSLDAAIARALAEQAEDEIERMAMYEEVQNARGPDGRSFSSIVGLGFASGGPSLNFTTEAFGPALGSSPPVTTPVWQARATPTPANDSQQGRKKGKGKTVLFRIG